MSFPVYSVSFRQWVINNYGIDTNTVGDNLKAKLCVLYINAMESESQTDEEESV